jgi:hypothetical protein
MGKVTGFLETDGRDRRYAAADGWRACVLVVLTLVLSLAVMLLSHDSASACRGWRGWPTGADLSKLRPGEIVVKSKLIESYRSEEPLIRSIMGDPYGMIYYVQISQVMGGAEGALTDIKGLSGEKVFLQSPPSVCEHYRPGFVKDGERILVLNKGVAGLYVIVGGQ